MTYFKGLEENELKDFQKKEKATHYIRTGIINMENELDRIYTNCSKKEIFDTDYNTKVYYLRRMIDVLKIPYFNKTKEGITYQSFLQIFSRNISPCTHTEISFKAASYLYDFLTVK